MGIMCVQVGDFGVLRGKRLDCLDICSAMSWLGTKTMGGTMGLRSTSITGGRLNDTHISSKILSVCVSVAVSLSMSLESKLREQNRSWQPITRLTWVTIPYALTCELAEGLEMPPEEVVGQLGNVCILPGT